MRKARLYDLRVDFDYKQKDIADYLHVKTDTYSKWERQINDMPLQKINELSKLYKVCLDYLLGLSNQKNRNISQNNINMTLLQKRLKQLRTKKKLSQKYLSEKLGFPQTTYSNYERGSRIITVQKLLMICEFYNISFDYITGKSNDSIQTR